MKLKIGELAKKSGCPVVTIRYYEKKGLLPEPDRNGSNYRLYDEADMERLRFVSAGIGINVSQGAEDFPEELRDRATSLAQETDRRLSRTEVLCVVLENAERAIDLCYADYGALLENYRARPATLGARVRATSATGDASITGVATDINENGELIVQDDAGVPHVLRAGDVSIRGMMGYV